MGKYSLPEHFEEAKAQRKSGRAVFDEYGRTVWEWQTATGVFERHITDEQLASLSAPALELVEPEPIRRDPGLWFHDSPRSAGRAATGKRQPPVRTFWKRLLG